MKFSSLLPAFCALTFLAGCQSVQSAPETPQKSPKDSAKESQTKMSLYDFQLKTLDGKPFDFASLKGKTLLLVNTASKCGYTKQYAGLQKLSETHKDKGLVVIGFPANNFGGQEPGSDEEIAGFCQKNYGVSFPMMSKLSVKGADQAPIFKYLTQEANPELKGDIGWNFEKFLISPEGQLVARFKSGVKPEDKELLDAIEAQLPKK